MASKTFEVTLLREGGMSCIPIPFDPKEVFGKVRAPVRVTINGYTFRSTIAAMGGPPFVPLRRSHREAAGLEGTETLRVRLDLDTEKREITPPPDLVKALKASLPGWERWQEMSYTHQREYVEAIEEAKKPETRARRVAEAVDMIRGRPARKRQPHGGPMAKTRSTAGRAQVRGVGWKRATTIDADKFATVSKAILSSLGRDPVTYTEMVRRVGAKLKGFEGSVSWYTVTVARELEVQGKLTRHAKPVRYSR